MIPIHKLEQLPAGHRRRKLALMLAAMETGFRDRGEEPALMGEITRLVLEDPKLERAAVAELSRLHEEMLEVVRASGVSPHAIATDPVVRGLLYRLGNCARHALLAAIGTFPAEWDLIVHDMADGAAPAGSSANPFVAPLVRSFTPGVSVYAEDIRSPFNLGSIFRTAEAFGAERLYLSPLCVPPEHSRAQRSAMGCIDYLPWERCSLESLPENVPVFALETGGTPIELFDFPEQGIVIIGSEELGVSPEGLTRATYGRVSIPMKGIKASLNVGVAFGIVMQAWTAYLPCSASNPR